MIAAKITSRAIVDLIEEGCEVVVTHGNGPQVGMVNQAMIALTHEDANQPNTPLSVCVAMSQAYIGYDLQNALREELLNRGITNIPVATMITQVRVDADDPAFDAPSKPIGKFVSKEHAAELASKYGYIMKEDAGRGYRRVVASPKPVEIVEIGTIRTMVDSGDLVIACGGGGIPVTRQGNHLKGASAVIDKDFVSSLLARELDADYLIILTAVEKVAVNFGKPDEQWLDDVTVSQAETYIAEGHFAPGSMLPKVQAAVDFAASRQGRTALITLLEKAKDGIQGKTGTTFHL
jgi:carbamate kinase